MCDTMSNPPKSCNSCGYYAVEDGVCKKCGYKLNNGGMIREFLVFSAIIFSPVMKIFAMTAGAILYLAGNVYLFASGMFIMLTVFSSYAGDAIVLGFMLKLFHAIVHLTVVALHSVFQTPIPEIGTSYANISKIVTLILSGCASILIGQGLMEIFGVASNVENSSENTMSYEEKIAVERIPDTDFREKYETLGNKMLTKEDIEQMKERRGYK